MIAVLPLSTLAEARTLLAAAQPTQSLELRSVYVARARVLVDSLRADLDSVTRLLVAAEKELARPESLSAPSSHPEKR